MSALGHQQHSALSASCLLNPVKRTLMVGFCASALGRYCCKKIFGFGAKNIFSKSGLKGKETRESK